MTIFFSSNWFQFVGFKFLGEVGCSYCGGLGHRITDCPRLDAMQSKQASNIGRKDYLASNAADW